MNASPSATPVHCQDCGLSKLCFPPSFDQQMLEEVAHAVGQIPVLPKGGVVYARGDAASALYAVRSGAVKTIIVDAQGEEQVTGFYLPGEVVGLEHLGQAQCITTAVALERSMLCALPITSMSQLSRQLPALQQHLFQIMSSAMSADYQRMHLLTQHSAESRVASFLLSLMERHRKRRLDPLHLRLPMSRGDLGNHLGLALETVSRTLGTLQQRGIVQISGRHVGIVDENSLARLGGSQCA